MTVKSNPTQRTMEHLDHDPRDGFELAVFGQAPALNACDIRHDFGSDAVCVRCGQVNSLAEKFGPLSLSPAPTP